MPGCGCNKVSPKEDKETKCPCKETPKVQIVCNNCCNGISGKCCCEDKVIFDINCDFCKLRQHKGACIKKCDCIYKLSVSKTCKGGCVSSPGVLICLETRPTTCYKIELEGTDICGVPAFVLVQDKYGHDIIPREQTKINVGEPFNFCLPFTAQTSRTLIGVNFFNDCANSELDICKFRVIELCQKDPCKPCDTTTCCEKPCVKPCEKPCDKPCEKPCERPCVKPCEKPKNDCCEKKEDRCGSCQNRKDACCCKADAERSKICQNDCDFKVSTSARIYWNNQALTSIKINGRPLNLRKIGNHDGQFTLDDVVNHNGDKQLAALIAKTLRVDRCSITVKTIIVIPPIFPTQNIVTIIDGLPLGTMVAATGMIPPMVMVNNVNAATRYFTKQIEPFFGVDVDATFALNGLPLVNLNFSVIFSINDLASVIRSVGEDPAYQKVFACDCGNPGSDPNFPPGTLFSFEPGTLIIGQTRIISSRIVPNPLLRAASCFDKVFGCSFTTMRDVL